MAEYGHEHLVKHTERAFPACMEPQCVLCLERCSFLCALYGYSMEAPWLSPSLCRGTLSPSGPPACLSTLLSGHCMQRPAASTPAPRLGCDTLAVAQRRQSFSVLPPSSVIKGRGKSRGEGSGSDCFSWPRGESCSVS